MASTKDNHHAISNLMRATDTYKTRNRIYGNNYKRFGQIMQSLFPQGVTLKTEHQWNRYGIMIQIISKLSRYVTDPMAGHIDSIHDMGVYCFMLEELDAEQAGFDVKSPVALVTVKDRREALPNDCEHVYVWPCQRDPRLVACEEGNCGHVKHTCGQMWCINCGDQPEADQ